MQLDRQDQQEPRALLVKQVLLVKQDRQAQLVKLVPQDRQAQQVKLVPQDRQAQLDKLVLQGRQESQEQQEQLDLWDHKERLVLMDKMD